MSRDIYCCECAKKVPARLTSGEEIYPHRPDLYELPFWICDECGNFVGCHHKTADRTRPLGCIPSPEIKEARKRIHAVLDPLWQSGKYSRRKLYAMLGEHIGRKYHTANIRTMEEANKVLAFIERLQPRATGGR